MVIHLTNCIRLFKERETVAAVDVLPIHHVFVRCDLRIDCSTTSSTTCGLIISPLQKLTSNNIGILLGVIIPD